MKAAKSRREQFEEQLKDLQNDISSLSHKLSVPTIITANRFGNSSGKVYSFLPLVISLTFFYSY